MGNRWLSSSLTTVCSEENAASTSVLENQFPGMSSNYDPPLLLRGNTKHITITEKALLGSYHQIILKRLERGLKNERKY